MFRNFVIAGGLRKNPAKVSMTLDPVRLDEKVGIAVKSIAYGELQNVNNENNILEIKFDHVGMIEAYNNGEYKGKVFGGVHTVTVPPAHYDTRLEVLEALIKTVNLYLKEKGFNGQIELETMGDVILINPPKYAALLPCSLLTYVGGEKGEGVWKVENNKLINRQIMGCLYLNIVENSFINGKKSRILCMCPFDYQPGYAFFEFRNPTYVPVEVREFSDISLSILDFNGKFVPFSNSYDTVVTLEMRGLQYK
eukprot:sb/3479751/